MLDEKTKVKSLGNGLTIYKDNNGVLFRKDYDNVPFAFTTLKYDVDANIVWTIKWDDGYNGCTIDHVMTYDTFSAAVDTINTHWDDMKLRKIHRSNFIYEEILEHSTNLQKDIAYYFGDSVYNVDKFNTTIYECFIHNYPVKVLMQFGKRSRFLLSLLYTVDVTEGARRTFITMRPELSSINGNVNTKWAVLSSKNSGVLSRRFDSFNDAGDYAWEISGNLVLSIVNDYGSTQYLESILAKEIAMVI